MDVRPIEMVHIINKSTEVTKIQNDDVHRYLNMQQYIAEEQKLEIKRRTQNVNDIERTYQENNINEDAHSSNGQDLNRYKNSKKRDELEDAKRPMGSFIDIIV